MGLEDYTVQLRPSTNTVPDVDKIEHTLKFLNFQKGASSSIMGGAQLAAPPQDESNFILHTDTYIIEAKLKSAPESPALLLFVSLRFAVCQPIKVAEDLQEIICDLAHRFNMSIYDANEEYTCHGVPCAFCSGLEERVRAKKTQWHTMFWGGIAEEPCLPVAQAWHYFISNPPEER